MSGCARRSRNRPLRARCGETANCAGAHTRSARGSSFQRRGARLYAATARRRNRRPRANSCGARRSRHSWFRGARRRNTCAMRRHTDGCLVWSALRRHCGCSALNALHRSCDCPELNGLHRHCGCSALNALHRHCGCSVLNALHRHCGCSVLNALHMYSDCFVPDGYRKWARSNACGAYPRAARHRTCRRRSCRARSCADAPYRHHNSSKMHLGMPLYCRLYPRLKCTSCPYSDSIRAHL